MQNGYYAATGAMALSLYPTDGSDQKGGVRFGWRRHTKKKKKETKKVGVNQSKERQHSHERHHSVRSMLS
ncbi:hypothetical protein, partial [Helicobacter pylori]|uniref:hypothetical protein n=1 Tax=Helicobacter pylori TaxID=210 RepID=UPI0036F1D1A9